MAQCRIIITRTSRTTFVAQLSLSLTISTPPCTRHGCYCTVVLATDTLRMYKCTCTHTPLGVRCWAIGHTLLIYRTQLFHVTWLSCDTQSSKTFQSNRTLGPCVRGGIGGLANSHCPFLSSCAIHSPQYGTWNGSGDRHKDVNLYLKMLSVNCTTVYMWQVQVICRTSHSSVLLAELDTYYVWMVAIDMCVNAHVHIK